MPYTPITATLGYVIDGQGNVLLIHRNKRPEDQALGKMNGLGGKVDSGEDIGACMVRE
ncbi:MAG: NUDIX domain-containing protein, partial [Armatimonadaceae bacterium]